MIYLAFLPFLKLMRLLAPTVVFIKHLSFFIIFSPGINLRDDEKKFPKAFLLIVGQIIFNTITSKLWG
jgi:hypothetical protein